MVNDVLSDQCYCPSDCLGTMGSWLCYSLVVVLRNVCPVSHDGGQGWLQVGVACAARLKKILDYRKKHIHIYTHIYWLLDYCKSSMTKGGLIAQYLPYPVTKSRPQWPTSVKNHKSHISVQSNGQKDILYVVEVRAFVDPMVLRSTDTKAPFVTFKFVPIISCDGIISSDSLG